MAFDNLQLDKGLYTTGQGFSAALEQADPSEQYRGTPLETLDAFERQLKRFGIRVSGAGSDRVEKFFQSAQSAALFPEFIARAVRRGLESADVLPRVVAATTQVDGLDYRSIACAAGEGNPEAAVAEGALLPETAIRVKAELVQMRKHGRLLSASYEAVRFHRLELFAVTLRQIGASIAKTLFAEAVDVLVNGDGNTGTQAAEIPLAGSAVTYADLITLWNSFDPYEMTTLLAPAAQMQQLLSLAEFRDANAGLNFHGSGRMITPLGADLIKSAAVPAGSFVALDKSCALEMVRAGEIVTDHDRLIDRQLDRAAISSTAGFAKLFPGAVKVLA
ncbi:MAG: phage major capsid protein [Oscillospiraceae bacterium]|jgi:hypothetical protein|nr:phage major capsid protein [Oscillospiraceae bacterium]